MTVRVFLDIETVPTQRPGAREEIAAGIKPPGQFKKPESIAEWLRDNRDAEADRAWRATALDGSQGEVIAVGLAVEDDPATVFMRRLEDTESALLVAAFDWIREEVGDRHGSPYQAEFVGWNVGFDLRFLWQRAVIRSVRPGVNLHQNARPGSEFVDDLMIAWVGWGNRCSLDAACRAIGIASPKADGVDGSKVWDMVQAGRYDKIREYCRADVEAVRALHARMTFLQVA